MAAGAPVIGLGRGGLLDTVRCAAAGCAQPTGVLFPDQSVESVVQAVEWFQQQQRLKPFSSDSIRLWAEGFRPEAFAARFEESMRRSWGNHQAGCAVAASDPAEVPGLFS
jgi:glycosyltransferase involved in cell wall biosynthesis